MSDTPRTDAVVNSLPQNDRGEITLKGIRNLIICCAELERELAEVTKQRDALKSIVEAHLPALQILSHAGKLEDQEYQAALAAVKGGAK